MLPPSKKPPPISTISLDARRDARLADQRQRDVGERPERAERDRAALLAHQRLDDEVDRVLVLQRHLRLRQVGAVEAGLAVHLLGRHQRRAPAAGSRRRRPSSRACRPARRSCGRSSRSALSGTLPATAVMPSTSSSGLAERQQDGDRVVLPGIGVDDDLLRCRHVPSLCRFFCRLELRRRRGPYQDRREKCHLGFSPYVALRRTSNDRMTPFSSPLLLGFDAVEKTLERLAKNGDSYPPYNIERLRAADGTADTAADHACRRRLLPTAISR